MAVTATQPSSHITALGAARADAWRTAWAAEEERRFASDNSAETKDRCDVLQRRADALDLSILLGEPGSPAEALLQLEIARERLDGEAPAAPESLVAIRVAVTAALAYLAAHHCVSLAQPGWREFVPPEVMQASERAAAQMAFRTAT